MTEEQRDAVRRLIQEAVSLRGRVGRYYRCHICFGVSPFADEQDYLNPGHVQHTEECAVMVVGRMLAEEEVE